MGPLSSPESHVSSHMGHMTTYRSSYIDFWEQYDFYFWFFHRYYNQHAKSSCHTAILPLTSLLSCFALSCSRSKRVE